MRKDLRDKIETLPPERQEKIQARSEELMAAEEARHTAEEAKAIAAGQKDLVEKLEDAPYTAEDSMSEHEWTQLSYEAAQEIKKLRAENTILHEEIRLREVISWKGKK